MASLVAEILSSAGKLEKEDISENVAKLSKHVDDIKLKIYEIIESEYKEFNPCVVNTECLADQVTNMQNEIHLLTNKIDDKIKGQLETATHEFHDLQQQLDESTIHANLLSQLLAVHKNLQNIDSCFVKKNYLGAAESIANVKVGLGDISHACDDRIHLLHSIRTEYLVRREKLIYDLGEIWNRHLIWNLPTSSKLSSDSTEMDNHTEFRLILTGEESVVHITNLMNAMQLLGQLKVKLKGFAEKFMRYIVHPAVKSSVELIQNDQPHSVSISVNISTKDIQPSPCDVIENLTTAFKFMYNSFLIMKVTGASNDRVPLMKILGEIMAEQFCDYIIENCLAEAIPKSSKNLEMYTPIIEASNKFQKLLIDVEFLAPDNEVMSTYTQSVNVLFVNKMCKDILSRAREMMKKELFTTVVIKPVSSAELSSTLNMGKDASVKSVQPENKITNMFTFPKCQISVTCQDLLRLVDEVLNEASISSAVCAARLFYTSRNIFELYCDVVPTYHKENLETLPHLSAIHHNNCMYLAHHLQTLGHKHKTKLPESMIATHITYVDLVPRIRKLGTDVFLNQMLRQKKILFECLKEAQGFQNIAMDVSFSPKAEKAIKQCLHQFQSVERVWRDVLPLNVYLKAIGTLVNSWIENITLTVISQEDISADSAFQLISLFQLISEQTPSLFKVSHEETAEIYNHVPYWSKFQELIIVLGASMQELVDRWTAGKGPLANVFSAEECKQLIRALFQNTDRRAAVLAKIK